MTRYFQQNQSYQTNHHDLNYPRNHQNQYHP